MVCTDDRQNNELAVSLARMLIHEITSGDRRLKRLSWWRSPTPRHRRGAEVVAAYQGRGRPAGTDTTRPTAKRSSIGLAIRFWHESKRAMRSTSSR